MPVHPRVVSNKSSDVVSDSGLFGKLDRLDQELLAADLHPAFYARGMLLQEQDEPIERVVFPQSGLISLMSAMAGGKNVQVAMLGRENALGVSVGLAPQRLAPYRAAVQADCLCQVIGAAPFLRALDHSLKLRVLMGRCYDAQVASAFRAAGCCAMHKLSHRLPRLLLEACDRVGADIVEVTHETLSLALGAQRSTITVIAHDLERRALIKSGRGRVAVLDRRGLQARLANATKPGGGFCLGISTQSRSLRRSGSAA